MVEILKQNIALWILFFICRIFNAVAKFVKMVVEEYITHPEPLDPPITTPQPQPDPITLPQQLHPPDLHLPEPQTIAVTHY